MGQFKPLLPLGGAPMLARVVESIQSVGGIGPVVVVTGHQSERVRSALADLDVRFAYNEAYEQGEMLSSVQAGVRAATAVKYGGGASSVKLRGDRRAREGIRRARARVVACDRCQGGGWDLGLAIRGGV